MYTAVTQIPEGRTLHFLTYSSLHFHLWDTIPELLLASCSETTSPTVMLSSKPSIKTRPLTSCCAITNLEHSCLVKAKSCTEVFPIRLEYAHLSDSTFLRASTTSICSYYNKPDGKIHNI